MLQLHGKRKPVARHFFNLVESVREGCHRGKGWFDLLSREEANKLPDHRKKFEKEQGRADVTDLGFLAI